MNTLDPPLPCERCTRCKRPVDGDPLEACWCRAGTPRELAVSDLEQSRVRSMLQDGSPGPVRVADRSKAKDGL